MVDQFPLLIAVTDVRRLTMPIEHWAQALYAGGVDIIQLREPGRAPEEIMALGTKVLDVAPRTEQLQINGHVEIARALDCGIHLPERSGTVRPPLSPASRSVHSVPAAAASGEFDFVIAGHIYPTASKPGLEPRGTAWLADVVRACPVPVIAIGGITADNTAQVIQAGASGIAVIGALTATCDPKVAVIRLRAALDNAWSKRQMQEQTTTIEIILNGKSAWVPAGSTILDLLKAKELTERLVVVELNGAIVPRSDFAQLIFSPGDRVEVVHFVGGGA